MTVRLVFGRPLPGTVGETRRVVHVFEVPTGDVVPERLTALCGTSFGAGELERLDAVQGMPCESCLRRTPTPDPELTDSPPDASDAWTPAPADIPDDVARDLAEHYTAGETIDSLVARHPYSYRKIRTALIDADVTLRPPRIPLPPTPPGMVNAYVNGRSIRQLASTYGMSYNQTRNILRPKVSNSAAGASPEQYGPKWLLRNVSQRGVIAAMRDSRRPGTMRATAKILIPCCTRLLGCSS